MSAQGGVCPEGGVCLDGCLPKAQVSVHGGYTPPPMDRQTPVKHYLSTTTVADSNKHIATDDELSNVPTPDKVFRNCQHKREEINKYTY